MDWFNFVRVDDTRHTQRASSWDKTGGNRDRLSIVRGDDRTLLEVHGPGCITHIWFTSHSIESNWLRKLAAQNVLGRRDRTQRPGAAG